MNRAVSVLFWFALTIVVSVALYNTSYRVQDLRHRLRALNASIENEQRSIHVLKAEWVFLANPARIEAAARKYLDLQPTSPRQIADMSNWRQNMTDTTVRMAQNSVHPAPLASTASKPTKVAALTVQQQIPAPEYVNTRMVINHGPAPAVSAHSAVLAAQSDTTP